jgi:predicted HD phosphohydrolase
MHPQPAKEQSTEGLRPACQAQSHLDEPCGARAITRCEKCGQWYCATHAEDDEWHACVLGEGDIGGEG